MIFFRRILPSALLALCTLAAPAQKPRDLQIFFVDAEGGQSTLFVTPTGQTLLIDTGWPGNDSRDAKRILAAAKSAGITKLDYVLLTHYHVDHTGGVPQLAALIPIGTFMDHGPNREFNDKATLAADAGYQKVLASGTYQHIVAKPGDTLPVTGIKATVISADGNLITSPLPGGGQPNDLCKTATPFPADKSENARSLGIEITFGSLRILDLGDLTQDKELQLVCPINRIGHPDIDIVSHHGWRESSNAAFVHALHPRVAIMDNGETKGGSLPVLETFLTSPGLETLWQLHFSAEGGADHNTPEAYIANPLHTDAGNFIKLTAHPDGSFDVLNSRTATSKHYAAKR